MPIHRPVDAQRPKYAFEPGCWRHGMFLVFSSRGLPESRVLRYDAWNDWGGFSFRLATDAIAGESTMQRAMFIRRFIDREISRAPDLTPTPHR